MGEGSLCASGRSRTADCVCATASANLHPYEDARN